MTTERYYQHGTEIVENIDEKMNTIIKQVFYRVLFIKKIFYSKRTNKRQGFCIRKMDKEILHEETIPKSVLVEISAFGTTSW